MKTKNLFLGITLFSAICFSACDEKNDPTPPVVDEDFQYIISATPPGSSGEVTDYLLQSNSLTSGSVTTTGAGVELTGYRYCQFHENKVFSLLYGQGNPGAVTTYALNGQGILSFNSNFQTPTVQVFGTYNSELILIRSPRSGNELAEFYRVNAVNPQLVGDTKYVNVVELAGNGERAHFTGVFQVDNKVYAPYYCIKGVTDAVFHSNYSDSTWVAVFSYPDMKLEKVIKDNRTSYIGYYFAQSGLRQIENGDVYAFSTATLGDVGVVPSTKPSAAIRIKKGTSEFDKTYFFNIQEKSGGHHLCKENYLGDNKFFLTMFADKNSTTGNKSFAIVDVVSQSFTWVTGFPAPDKITNISQFPYVMENGNIAVGISTSDDLPYIYVVDKATAQATKGMKVEASKINAIGKLTF